MKAEMVTRKVLLTELQARAIEMSWEITEGHLQEIDDLKDKIKSLKDKISFESQSVVNAINQELKGTKLPEGASLRLFREDGKPPRAEWDEVKKKRAPRTKKKPAPATSNGTNSKDNSPVTAA